MKAVRKIEVLPVRAMVSARSLTSLQQSLVVLAALKGQIEMALNTLGPLGPSNRLEDENLKFTVCNHIQILLCSFLDEWRSLESLGKVETVRATLEIASPALNRIRGWTGLSKVRSTLLAHGHRDKHGKLALAWDVFATHSAPTTYAETILLGQCAILAANEAYARHQADYQVAMDELSKSARDIEVRGIRTTGEINAAFEGVKAEMSRIALKYSSG